MPQTPAARVGATGDQLSSSGGASTSLNITTTTVVKASLGRICKVSVIVAGSATGKINDCATTGAVAASNEIAVIPETVGIYSVDFPCNYGITITPGTGQTVSVSFL